MNLFFYLQTFILNYSFIVILSDHIFVLCFIKTQPFVKRKPVKTEKIPERSRSVLGKFTVFLYFLLLLSIGRGLLMADLRLRRYTKFLKTKIRTPEKTADFLGREHHTVLDQCLEKFRPPLGFDPRAGRYGDLILVGARFSAPVQTGSGAHPAACTMGTESFPGVNQPGRGFNHPPHLPPRLKKE
jgi:hypothetical protein